MAKKDLSIAMVGAGGDGIVTMGDMLAQASARVGLNVIKVEAYGPQIRGGESSCVVRVSPEPLYAQGDTVDVLCVFSWADFARFQGEVLPAAHAFVLCEENDPVKRTPEDLGLPADARWIPVPFAKLAAEAGAKPSKNILALAILAEVFGLPKSELRRSVEARFGKKRAGVVESVLKAFDAGSTYGAGLTVDSKDLKLSYTPGATKVLMSGNEAVAIGAVHAGCRFFAGYPITPSSEVLHFLSEWLPRVGGRVVQTEDELAAYGAVIGGSFAGVKSMTATSGPGLSLMTEMLGLSGMSEIPTVIVDVQRGGPSTGLPTKSEQSDLWQAVFASHGDAPRVVLAACDVEDCFHATVEAFNISEEYQLPVIVLSDQAIGQARESLDPASFQHEVRGRRVPTEKELEGYQRYLETPTGVSPMSFPGMKGGIYQTNGLEHDESGRPSSMYLQHEKMNAKRYRKLLAVRDAYSGMFRRFGPEKADLGILCWGSSKGPVEEAVIAANARGQKVAAFVPQMLYPFPKRAFQEFLGQVEDVLIIEISYTAQFYRYLRTFMNLPEGHVKVWKRSGGKNLAVAEVEEQIRKAFETIKSREEVLV